MEIYIDLHKNDNLYQAILEYPVDPGYDMDLFKKIQEMVFTHNDLYQKAKVDLQNVFRMNEVKLILSTLIFRNSSDISGYFKDLYLSILNNFEEEDVDIAFEVDKESLMERIAVFTDFQAFTLFKMAIEVKKELVRLKHSDLLGVQDFIIELFKPIDYSL